MTQVDTSTGIKTPQGFPKGFIKLSVNSADTGDSIRTFAINGILSIQYSKSELNKCIMTTHRRLASGQNEVLTVDASHDAVIRTINDQLQPGQQFPDTTFADNTEA